MNLKEQEKAMENNPVEVANDARETRRRLLKIGAVGAPLILTFRSTSAWAVSAGCLIQQGDLPIPGAIIKVDENFEPILKDGVDKPKQNDPWYENYQSIFISKGSGDVADGQLDSDSLRALVYNNNIGQTCLASINGLPTG